MANKTDICNLALLKFGDDTIVNIDQSQDRKAKILRLIYTNAIKTALRAANWNFAKSYKMLQRAFVGADEITLYPFCFYYPQDCLYIRKFIYGKNKYKAENYGRKDIFISNAGKKLISLDLEKNIIIEYTKDVTENTDVWDAGFINAAVYRLAYEICYSLSGKTEKSIEFMNVYQMEIDKAIADSLNESNEQEDLITDSINAYERAYNDLP